MGFDVTLVLVELSESASLIDRRLSRTDLSSLHERRLNSTPAKTQPSELLRF